MRRTIERACDGPRDPGARSADREIIDAMVATAQERLCPHCQTPNPAELNTKCVKCRKRMGPFCFACYASVDETATVCAACGRGRWVVGDHAQLACVVENGAVRDQRFMATVTRGGKILNEWRCMRCLTDETRSDPFAHFPER